MYIYKKSLGFISTIGEEREERERDPLTRLFFLVPARQPILFGAFDCPFRVF